MAKRVSVMTKQVKGFLASDGLFFEREPECKRHEAMQSLAVACDSHGTNFDNFLAVLNAWHIQIKEYYNADQKCKEQYANGNVATFERDEPTSPDELPAFLRSEDDHPDIARGDKDSPGFLEQSFGRNK